MTVGFIKLLEAKLGYDWRKKKVISVFSLHNRLQFNWNQITAFCAETHTKKVVFSCLLCSAHLRFESLKQSCSSLLKRVFYQGSLVSPSRSQPPRLSTNERANVSAKPNPGISQQANEKQVISTQYSACITRQCGRLAGGKVITLHN